MKISGLFVDWETTTTEGGLRRGVLATPTSSALTKQDPTKKPILMGKTPAAVKQVSGSEVKGKCAFLTLERFS